jgi:hypothetical protein
MKKKNSSQAVSLLIAAVIFLCVLAAFLFLGKSGVEVLETDTISWADAAEKCKDKYKSLRPAGTIKVSNSRKRLWDDEYFYFYWRKPLSIFIKDSNGVQTRNSGNCQVSRESGDIVYMTLNDKEIVKKQRK